MIHSSDIYIYMSRTPSPLLTRHLRAASPPELLSASPEPGSPPRAQNSHMSYTLKTSRSWAPLMPRYNNFPALRYLPRNLSERSTDLTGHGLAVSDISDPKEIPDTRISANHATSSAENPLQLGHAETSVRSNRDIDPVLRYP